MRHSFFSPQVVTEPSQVRLGYYTTAALSMSRRNGEEGGSEGHGTEVAFKHLNQLLQVQIPKYSQILFLMLLRLMNCTA